MHPLESAQERVTSTHETSYDVVVVGSGAAGMSAALTAKLHGLKVLVVEKASTFGGTTARSGGWLWVPGASQSKAAGISEVPGAVEQYVCDEAKGHFDPHQFAAFLKHGPAAIDFLGANTSVQFDAAPHYPDYHPEMHGASSGGRSLLTRPCRGTDLGAAITSLSPPLPELTVFGMMLGSGKEIWHFLRAFKSIQSFAYVARRLAGNALDVLRFGRPMTLTSGNALAARFLKSALGLGIDMWASAPARRLTVADGRVVGVVVERDGEKIELRAKRGVVLACGGFPHDLARRKQLFAHAPTGREHYSPTPETNTGDGQRMAELVGAAFDAQLSQPAAWVPVSVTSRADGTKGILPHFIDRAKPGVIAVNTAGKRFVNEAASYHDFGQAMIETCRGQTEATAWLVCDRQALRNYGLGNAAAFPMPIGRHLRSGYLKQGRTPPELAAKLNIDPIAFQATIDAFNRDAANGVDTAFNKGGSAYNRFMGDPRNVPNPCIRPLDVGPFYAVKLVLGDLGTYAGLRTDHHGRVLNADKVPIEGLYAAGNDAVSVMGGAYPGAGITLGPAVTFGYLCGLHLAQAPAQHSEQSAQAFRQSNEVLRQRENV
ncbi:FAD-dependent oxidoreductase [Variovorax sp. J22R133]|uniref:FAD-dependent oxidoreductase n=1 Tax=Variovorax brevis TaxID=3053503 RepID=UPI0025763021|nr:FAD-dependent oxidoreductase [Variovorax sp. J22R133]MDM0116087.1 FAD-dependent oxidoreductase [Variovorax sp. J22R133]